jgi:hypothetical protein
VYVGVALVSAAVIVAQIAFTRTFALSLWYHFAYLAIGVAQLGAGVAGSWLTVKSDVSTGSADVERLLAQRARFAALGTFAALLILATIRTNALALFRDPSVAVAFVLLIALAAVPFFGAGLVIGTALFGYPRRAGGIYGADLLGAATGAFVVAVALGSVAAPRLLFGTAALTAIAALLFGWRAPLRDQRWTFAALAGVLFVTVVYGKDEMWVRPAPGKELNWVHMPDVGINTVEHREWTSQGRIDVTTPYPSAPALGGDVVFPWPVTLRAVTQDGSAPTHLYQLAPEADASQLAFFPYATTAAVWELRGAKLHQGAPPANGPSALVLGFGGGIDGLMALAYGAHDVTGVDVNRAIIDLHQRYRDFTGRLAERPGVSIVHAEGRAFVRTERRQFDIIQLSGVDTFTALAGGAYTVAEAYVYTREAFDDYLARLTPGGCLQISRPVTDPPRETLRLAGTAAESMRRAGDATPASRIVVVHGIGWGSLIACKTAIGSERMQRLRAWTKLRGFAVAFDPERTADGPYDQLLSADAATRDRFLSAYPYRVDPSSDEVPFFFDYFKWRRLLAPSGVDSAKHPYVSAIPVGHGLMAAALVSMTFLALVGILRPLRRLGVKLGRVERLELVYFAGLGLAFLFVEVALFQRMTFLLGHPSYAMSVVLGGLLAACGLGAFASRHVDAGRLGRALPFCLCAALVACSLVSHWLIPSLKTLSLTGRVGASLAVLLPLGALMGMPFPIGIERVRKHSPALVPWAFGVNAFVTVVASTLAPIVAMQIGFSALLPLAALVYVAAFVAARRATRA